MQTRAAEERRAQLRASGVLTPVRAEIARLYANPVYADMTQQIGAMLNPPLAADTIGAHVRALTPYIGPNGSLNKLIAILSLAPI